MHMCYAVLCNLALTAHPAAAPPTVPSRHSTAVAVKLLIGDPAQVTATVSLDMSTHERLDLPPLAVV